MRCKYCGSEIPNEAKFCRYCGNAVETEHVPVPPPVPSPKKHKAVRVCVAVSVLLVTSGLIFVLTTGLFDKPAETAYSVKKISLQNEYTLENDQLKLGKPTATYVDGKEKALTDYKVYIDNKACRVKDGCVKASKVDAGKHTIILEWKQDGKTYQAEKKIEVKKDNSKETGNEKTNTVGNTLGNLCNGGYLTRQGDWYYYSQGHAIYKTKNMGKGNQKLCDARWAANLNVVGEWVYYTCQEGREQYNTVIRKMKTDGSNGKTLYADGNYSCKQMAVVKDQIVFQTVDMDSMGDTGTLYIMGLEKGEPTELLDEEVYFFGIDENYAYYQPSQTDENVTADLCRMDLKTKKSEVVLEGDSAKPIATNPVLEDGWIYYATASGGESLDLTRTNLETGDSENITSIDIVNYEGFTQIHVKDGWIYFNDATYLGTEDEEGETVFEVMKVKADGSNRTGAADCSREANIFVCGDEVFCSFADAEIFVGNEDDLRYRWEILSE